MWADPDADYEKIGARAGRARGQDRRRRARGTSSATSRSRWTPCGCPPGDADVADAVRRRAAPGRAVPPAAVETRPAAARRAHQPPRRRVGRVARAVPAGVPRHRRRHHPRPLLPRQRRPLDPRARPRPGHPVRGQLLVVARAEAALALAAEEKQSSARQRTLERELEWVRMAPKARQAKGKARLGAYEKLLAEAEADAGARRQARDHRSRPGDRLGDTVIEVDRLRRRATATASSSRTCRSRCRPPASSASSGRTAPARPRCSGCSPGPRHPTAAASRSATPCSSPTSTSRATCSTPTRPSTRRSPAASST